MGCWTHVWVSKSPVWTKIIESSDCVTIQPPLVIDAAADEVIPSDASVSGNGSFRRSIHRTLCGTYFAPIEEASAFVREVAQLLDGIEPTPLAVV